MQVFVRDNDVEQALRIQKRKMQREGVFREMRRRRFYEKPSDKATREKAEGVRQAGAQTSYPRGLDRGPIKEAIGQHKEARENRALSRPMTRGRHSDAAACTSFFSQSHPRKRTLQAIGGTSATGPIAVMTD